MAKIKEENEILQLSKLYVKMLWPYFAKKLDEIIQVIEDNRETYSIKKK